MTGIGKMMKQMKKVQQEIQQVQEALSELEAEGSAGGGVVTAKATGDRVLQEVKIDPSVISREDVEMLEDLVLAAVNQALKNAEELAAAEMEKVTRGMGLPPGMGL